MLSFQAAGKNYSEFDAPEADRFMTNGDTALSEKGLDIAMAQVESIIEPNRTDKSILGEFRASFYSISNPVRPSKALAGSSSGSCDTSSPRKTLAKQSTFGVSYIHGGPISQLDREELSCLNQVTDSSVSVVDR